MKTWELEGAQKFEKLLQKFENHPLTQSIRADEASETLSARQRAAVRIEVLKKEQSEAITRLQAVSAEKETKFNQAKAAFEIAGAAWNAARAALTANNTEIERQIRVLENTLYESFDPAIDEAIQFFRNHLDYLRSPGRIDSRPTR